MTKKEMLIFVQEGLEKNIGIEAIRKNMPCFYEGTVEINGIKVVYELNDNNDCVISELDNDEEHYGEYPEYEE